MVSCLNSLDLLMQQPETIVSCMIVAPKSRNTEGDSSVGLVEAVAAIIGKTSFTLYPPIQKNHPHS